MLSPCQLLADVGTDHGLLPLSAVALGVAERAIAADLREAPLRGARRNIELSGLKARVTTLQADGLHPLTGRGVDAVVLAGMSGKLIQRLCSEAPQLVSELRQLVLQPNQDADTLRAWALAAGLHLQDERLVAERGRCFITCRFVPGAGPDPAYQRHGWDTRALCQVGPLLLAKRDALTLGYYEAQRARLTGFAKRGSAKVREELATWQAACESRRNQPA